jgi:hypothetical protein
MSDKNRIILSDMQYAVLQCRPSTDHHPSSSRSLVHFLQRYLIDEARKHEYFSDISSQLGHAYHALPFIIKNNAVFGEISYEIYMTILNTQAIQDYFTYENLLEVFSAIRLRERWPENIILDEVSAYLPSCYCTHLRIHR